MLSRLDNGRYLSAIHFKVDNHRHIRQIIVPLVTVHDLEVPLALSSLNIQSYHSRTKKVVAG